MPGLISLAAAAIANVPLNIPREVWPPIILFQPLDGLVLPSVGEDFRLMCFANQGGA